MPTYIYFCQKCQINWELIHSMLDEKEKLCPNCMNKLTKKIQSNPIIFKTNGYYKTDNRK